MLTDFSAEYSNRSDDELLHLLTQRHLLTREAANALLAELQRRNLTSSDGLEHQQFEKRQEWHEFRDWRRKIFGKNQLSWIELLSAFAAMAVVAGVYLSLPQRYHLKPDWQEAAVCVAITSIVVIVGWKSAWLDTAFWMTLILSSAVQLAVVHAWVQRVGELSRGAGKLAVLLGFVVFIAIYECMRLLQRNFYGDESL